MKSSQAAASRRPGVPAVGEVIAGKYRVEGIVGAGGMGVVVSARHQQLDQVVAIKLLTPPLDEDRRDESIARFLQEAQAAAKLQSDHVVRIYDIGQLANGMPFMVMELLPGADFGRILEQQGPMPEAQAVDFVLQACAGVSEAHRRGIVHRDLKPSNLFVTQRSDGLSLLKVLDFGISKQLTDPLSDEFVPVLTNTRTLMGSPNYMSPEQVRDARRVDARTDVWALGIILQELLTNAPVFHGESFPGVCAAIVADPPTPVRALRPDISRALEAVLERCLQKDPDKRFQSVAELVSALSELAPRVSVAGSDPRPLVYSSGKRLDLGGTGSSPARPLGDDSLTVQSPGGEPTLESARLLTAAGTLTAISAPESRIQVLSTPPGKAAPASGGRGVLLLGALGAAALFALFWLTRQPASSGAESSARSASTPLPAVSLSAPSLPARPPPEQPAAATNPEPPASAASAASESPPASSASAAARQPKRPPSSAKPKPAPVKPAPAQPASDIRLER